MVQMKEQYEFIHRYMSEWIKREEQRRAEEHMPKVEVKMSEII